VGHPDRRVGLLARAWLADENVQPSVVRALVERGVDIVGAVDAGLGGALDTEVARFAAEQGRIVLTHDRGFAGQMAALRSPPPGVVVLRPGDMARDRVLAAIDVLPVPDLPVGAPFLIVAERRGTTLRVRLRRLR